MNICKYLLLWFGIDLDEMCKIIKCKVYYLYKKFTLCKKQTLG